LDTFRGITKAVEGATPFKPKKGEQPGQTMEQFIMRAAEGERRSPRGQKGTRKEKAAQTGEVGACSSSGVQGGSGSPEGEYLSAVTTNT